MKKVLLLALSDYYWADFTYRLARTLRNDGMDVMIAAESRLGVYQAGLVEQFKKEKVYYLSDYIKQRKSNVRNTKISSRIAYPDYIRIGHMCSKCVNEIDWSASLDILINYVNFVLDEYKPSVIIHEQISTAFSFAFYEESKLRNIEYLGFLASKLDGRMEVGLSFDVAEKKIHDCLNLYLKNKKEISEVDYQWASQFIENIKTYVPQYMVNNKLNDYSFRKVVNIDNFRYFIRTLFYCISTNELHLFRLNPIKAKYYAFKFNVTRAFKTLFLKKNFDEFDIKKFKGNKVYLYPIHYQPEASTCVNASNNERQLDLIEKIAFNLYSDEILLVKEHVSNFGRYSKQDYNRIKNLPNVFLLAPEENTKEILLYIDFVITLTSTVGFEALLLDKKAITFGDIFYNAHKNSFRARSVEEMRNFLDDQSMNITDHNYNIKFLLAYKSNTFSGSIRYGASGLNIIDDIRNML